MECSCMVELKAVSLVSSGCAAKLLTSEALNGREKCLAAGAKSVIRPQPERAGRICDSVL